MKINIVYFIKSTPWGGGNQFLKSLKNYFISKSCYSESPQQADVILFNSHHELRTVSKLKKKYPSKTFIHRLGPIFTYARKDPKLDKKILKYNIGIADGTIFQSNWSKQNLHLLGLKEKPFETVITNASDPNIFFPSTTKHPEGKLCLITTSWSPNFVEKGFDILLHLDRSLDFEKYEMTFVGNSPVLFRNIKSLSPQPSRAVAELLRASDIFIIPSINDACSNSLIEALHCGLPAVARNSGGHPEIVKEGGLMFENKEDILEKIWMVANNIKKYRDKITVPNIDEVGRLYYEFCEKVNLE